MDTKNFNFIDKIVAKMRMGKVLPYINHGDVVLDFGCGNKSFLLSTVSSEIRFGVGLDYDVQNKKEKNIEYIKYKFNGKLPFKDKYFDKIFLLAVLEHIEPNKINGLFLEFKRILKKNGFIILTTPTPKSKWLLELLAYKLHIISEREIRDHKKYYNKNDLLTLIRKIKLNFRDYKKFQLGLNSIVLIDNSIRNTIV